MQLSFTLNLRRYPSYHDLHFQLRKLGFVEGGFIPPRFGFNRRLGRMDYPKLLKEAQRLNRLCPDWVPLILDLEKAFRWARANPPGPRDNIPLSPEGCYDLIRETYNFMRLHFPERYLTDWGRNARWTNVLTDRLGCGITAQCPVTNRKVQHTDDAQWLAVRSQEYAECLTWRMPVYLWMSPWNWSVASGDPSRPLTDAEWELMIDFAVEREPDWIIYSGSGDPTYIQKRAATLVAAVAQAPEFTESR